MTEHNVAVDCPPGQGDTFIFSSVLEKGDPGGSIQEGDGVEVQGGKPHRHILLVEDNPANRVLAAMILQGAGYSVVEVGNGLEALEKLAEEEFGSILMDIQMPIMDGIETTKLIRALERGGDSPGGVGEDLVQRLKIRLAGKHHPIIALTAHAMTADREKCLEAGVDAYLTKPFVPEQILATLYEIGG